MPTIQLPKQICSQPFGMDALSIVREIIDDGQKEGIHRSEVARRVCIALDWRNARGGLKEMGARVALLQLHRQGWITLPEPRQHSGKGTHSAERLARASVPEPPASDLCCPLLALGCIHLRQVGNKAESLLWNALIDRYHYLGYSPLSGAQMRYLIDSDRGLVAAPSVSVRQPVR